MALALSSALFTLPARADDDPAVLMVKHAVFTGWQLGDGKVKTLISRRTGADKSGKPLFDSLELRAGMFYRRDLSYPDGTADSSGFTGRLFWESHENGFSTPVTANSAPFRLAFDAVLAEGTPQLPATSDGTGTIDGKSYDIVNVTMEGADPMDLWIDPASGAYARVVIDPKGDDETTLDKLAYATVGGKKFLSSFTYADDGEVVTYSEFKPNAPVTAATLHPPAPSATWAFTNDKPFKIRVTTDRIYVDATLNGVAGRFILDTGSYGILLTRKFAGKINAKAFSHTRTIGIGGEGDVKTDLLKVDTVQIGGNTLSNVVVGVNKAEFHDTDEDPDGLIGFPLFGGAVVEVSTSAQTMAIHDPQSSLDAFPGVTVLPDLSDGTPVVPMKLNGDVDVNATLDTGNPTYVFFAHDLAAKTGMKFLVDNSSAASHLEMSGVSGSEIDQCGSLDSLQLGPVVYSPAPGCSTFSETGRDVVVGFDLLKNFDFVFAYPQGKIILIPHKQ